MPTVDDIMDVLRTIDDPEMPISIVDLGIVEDVSIDDGQVAITVLPTFVGCPALPMIERMIRDGVSEIPGVAGINVTFTNDPPWTVDRISEKGRESLQAHGVTVPASGNLTRPGPGSSPITPLQISAIPCPYCGSSSTRLDSPFGPTRCRMIYYCDACRNQFEHMKRVAASSG